MIDGRRICARAAAATLCVTIVVSRAAAPDGELAGQRRFAVHDSVEMSEFTDVGCFSPDGRYYVTVTQRGVLPQGVSEATVWLFETSRIRTWVTRQKPATTAAPAVLARMSAAVNGGGYDGGNVIMHLAWASDSRSLTFLGRDGQENRRLFRVSLDDHRAAALTPPDQDVVDYGSAGRAIAYIAGPDVQPQKSWWSDDPSAPDIVVGTGQAFMDLLYPNYRRRTQTMPSELEVWRIREGGAEPVIDTGTGKALRLLASYIVSTVALSSDGKHMVGIAFADRIPAPWENYELVVNDNDLRRFVADPVSKDGSALTIKERSSDFSRALQYQLIELDTGSRRPLLAAPLADFQRGGSDWLRAAWSPDGDEVAVSATYLPIGEQAQSALALRACSVAVIGRQRGDVTCIRHYEPKSSPVYAVQWDAAGRQLLVQNSRPGSPGFSSELYKRKGSHWDRAKSRPSAPGAPLEISVAQSLNEPPALLAKDPLTGVQKKLFDPNPQLAGINLGSVSVYTWKDKHDRVIRGGLAKPPDFQPGRKYALVIQTHGFAPGDFFRMGYSETSSGGRALAGRDIVVLQVAEPHPPFFGTWREGTENGTEVYLAAIDQLAAQGLIDPARVGITGYSRRGFYVAKAITDAPDRFAAAVVANADPGSLIGYYTYVDYVTPTYITGAAEAFAGTAPYGEGLQKWLQRAPGFLTDRIRTPVLVSAADPQHLISLWGLYAPLRDQGKPVELQYMRSGQHNLTKPLQKLAHQEMIVDWFDFWLNGHEEPDSAKAEQYARWRKLRDLHEAQTPAAPH
jgi:dipeptidyl aminopeptidase/acylaminoacyl peptidase